MVYIKNKTELKDLRQKLRKSQTEAEKKIWNLIRNRQVQELKFFRQYGLGNYILDFYCPQIKLAIEVDGGQHNTNEGINSDRQRSNYLATFQIRVLRFWNNDVLTNIEGVYQKIIETINSSQPPL